MGKCLIFIFLIIFSVFQCYSQQKEHNIIVVANNKLVDFRSFGAKGDSISDDAVAFTNAIKYALLNNLSGVYVPKGTWFWKSTPYLPLNLKYKFFIVGNNSTIKLINSQFTALDKSVSDFDFCKNITISNFLIDAKNINKAGHCIIGNRSNNIDIYRVSWENINITDIKVLNLPIPKVGEFSNFGILIQSIRSKNETNKAINIIKNISCSNVDIVGGSHGIMILGHLVGGQDSNVQISDVSIKNCSHITNLPYRFKSTGLHIGGSGLANRVLIDNFSAKGQGDNCIEINNTMQAVIKNCSLSKPFAACITLKNTKFLNFKDSQDIRIFNNNLTLADNFNSCSFLLGSESQGDKFGVIKIYDCNVKKQNDSSFNSQGIFINSLSDKDLSIDTLFIDRCKVEWLVKSNHINIFSPSFFKISTQSISFFNISNSLFIADGFVNNSNKINFNFAVMEGDNHFNIVNSKVIMNLKTSNGICFNFKGYNSKISSSSGSISDFDFVCASQLVYFLEINKNSVFSNNGKFISLNNLYVNKVKYDNNLHSIPVKFDKIQSLKVNSTLFKSN